MKLAISGKGGAGKSTLAAAIILLMALLGRKILAVDANPMIYFVVSKTS
jgi:CO dehydrogenase nickel-insertion accessory protein CooC1